MANLGCSSCYTLKLPTCSETLIILTGIPATTIHWCITDEQGTEYLGSSISDSDGNIFIDTTLEIFPEGLFTPYSGKFTFKIKSLNEDEIDICSEILMTICEEEYTCIDITFFNQSTSEVEPEPVCDPVVVTVNGDAYDSYEAGDTPDIPVEYENGTPVGTKVGLVIEIPNPVMVPSLTIGVFSDAGLLNPIVAAELGETVYVQLLPVNLVPTDYTVFVDNGLQAQPRQELGTSVFSVVLLIGGNVKISGIASVGATGTAEASPFALTVSGIRAPFAPIAYTDPVRTFVDAKGNFATISFTALQAWESTIAANAKGTIDYFFSSVMFVVGGQIEVGFETVAGNFGTFTGILNKSSPRQVRAYENGVDVGVIAIPSVDSVYSCVRKVSGKFSFQEDGIELLESAVTITAAVYPVAIASFPNNPISDIHVTRY